MNATTRIERRTNHRAALQRIRNTRRTTRAARRIHTRGHGTLTQHAMATGLTHRQATSMTTTTRKTATKLGLTPTTIRVHAGRRMRTANAYTPAQMAIIATAYRPRKPEFKAAAAKLRLAA